MTRYKIEHTESGHIFGTFEGENELAAYQACLVDAGYSPTNLPAEIFGEGATWDEIPRRIEITRIR